jgi:hypothetical protein
MRTVRWEFTGEYRQPSVSEWFYTERGPMCAQFDFTIQRFPILRMIVSDIDIKTEIDNDLRVYKILLDLLDQNLASWKTLDEERNFLLEWADCKAKNMGYRDWIEARAKLTEALAFETNVHVRTED